MSGDDVFDLLDVADASIAPPPLVNLAEKVRTRARVRAHRRRVAAAAAVFLLVGALPLLLIRSHRTRETRPPQVVQGGGRVPAPRADPDALRLEAVKLRAEAAQHLAVARGAASESTRRRRPVAARQPGAELSGTLEGARERAALVMLDHADRLRRDLNELDAALAAYRRTVELFPGTRWAAVASQRIEEMNPETVRPRTPTPEHLT